MEGKRSLPAQEPSSTQPVSGWRVSDQDGLGSHWSAPPLGDGRTIGRSDLAFPTACGSRDQSGLLVSTPVLAVSLLKVKDEADMFYLYVDIYTLKQPPPAFADCTGFLRVECMSTDGDGAGETHCLREFNHGI